LSGARNKSPRKKAPKSAAGEKKTNAAKEGNADEQVINVLFVCHLILIQFHSSF